MTSTRTARCGLPAGIRACLFDLDGVLANTTPLHVAAWKEMFDAFLRERSARHQNGFVAFDEISDYARYVDGKLRYDGVRSFLASRGIELPEGEPTDPGTVETICGLGNRKNDLVLELMRREGVAAFPGSVRYVRAARAAGLRRAVVSSSENCRDVLAAAGIEDLFEVRVDAVVAHLEHLRGKPAPDTFRTAARALGVPASRSAVFEDALSGVSAGRSGGFGFVVGVNRSGQEQALREHGADVVVADLADLLREDTAR